MASVPPPDSEPAPNQGATGDAQAETTAASGVDPGPAGAGAPINQGAPGAGPEGPAAYDAGAEARADSPGGVDDDGGSAFEERPELFVAGAFIGGFALAQILKRFGE